MSALMVWHDVFDLVIGRCDCPEIVTNPSTTDILHGAVPTPRVERVLAYLAKAEFREIDPWVRDDIRVAWLTVLRASEGHPDPYRYSFWTYFGLVPEKAIPLWAERRRETELMLQKISGAYSPKKPSASVPCPKSSDREGAA